MDVESLFRANLALIDRVVREVCRRGRLPASEVEDFLATVHLALIDNDFAILRRWEGRASLAGYLSIVIRRLLSDQRAHEFGSWHPSAEAKRMGEAAMLLERLHVREGRSLDDALPVLRAADPSLTAERLAAMASRFPSRTPRPRRVFVDALPETPAAERADGFDSRELADRAAGVVRDTMARWPDEDVVVLRFRFGASMSIADISRMFRIPQRPLYRRIESMLRALRDALTAAGLGAAALADVLESSADDLDFGLDGGKNGEARASCKEGTSASAGGSQ